MIKVIYAFSKFPETPNQKYKFYYANGSSRIYSISLSIMLFSIDIVIFLAEYSTAFLWGVG